MRLRLALTTLWLIIISYYNDRKTRVKTGSQSTI